MKLALSEELSEQLRKLAAFYGVSIDEMFRRVVGTQAFVQEAQLNGKRFLLAEELPRYHPRRLLKKFRYREVMFP